MDPLTLASKRFQTEVRMFWEPPPGRAVPTPPVLRAVTTGSYHKDTLKSLRLLEWAPENRHPFIVVEDAFDTTAAFLAAFARKLESDYAKLRKGLADDGLEIDPLPSIARPVTTEGLITAVQTASREVARVLAGLVVAIMPQRIQDARGYAEFVAGLGAASNNETLRVVVSSTKEIEKVFPSAATFEVDEPALLSYLKNLGATRPGGPPSSRIQATPEQLREVEARTGKRIPPERSARDLRALLLDAGDAMSKGQFKIAARKFRAARMLCHLIGQPIEEGAVSVAVGSAALAGGDRMAALAAFRRGKEIAKEVGSPPLATQATFGIAGTYFFGGEYALARAAYVELMQLAAENPPMRLEAMRMEAECFVHEGRGPEALRSFGEVLDATESLPHEIRPLVPYVAAGKRLASLYDEERQTARAQATLRRVAQLGEQPLAGGAQ